MMRALVSSEFLWMGVMFSYLIIIWIFNLQVTILENVYWKELGLLVFVWVSFLALQIAKVCSFTVNNTD